MSKILKSFGMAALLVALLAGTGMGQVDSDPVAVGGCIRDELAITSGPTTTIDFDIMSSDAPATDDNDADITVEATVAWELTWLDTEAATKTAADPTEAAGIGKMYRGVIDDVLGVDRYLTNGLTVNTVAVGGVVESGAANIEDCDDVTGTDVDLDYSQTIDATDDAGDYVLNIKYVLSEDV